jgi:hypothetical protein
MARKKANISAITFIKEFPRKRPGRHAKSYNKKFHVEKIIEDRVFEIASYKGLVIALILVNGELLKIELFDDTCAEFWNKNVTVHEKKN